MLRIFDSVEYVQKLVTDLRKQRFYGSVELKFEDGCLVLIHKTETIKPS